MKMRLPLLIICTRCRSRGGHVLMSTCDALSAAGAYVLTQASVRTRALPLSPSNALLLTRSPLAAHAAGIAQSGRISRSCVRADARSSHARLRMCTLSLQHPRGQTRAHTPSHAMSLNRADSCVVAFKSNALSLTRPACATRALARAVSRASGTHASSFSKSNARWLTRTATRSARGLNRPLLLVCRRKGCYTHGGHARADAREARPGARYLAVVRRRFQGRTHCHSHGRPPAAHAAGIAHSCVCGDVAFSLAQTHSRALSRPRMHMRAHCISSHALCLERASTCVDAPESDARWPSRA